MLTSSQLFQEIVIKNKRILFKKYKNMQQLKKRVYIIYQYLYYFILPNPNQKHTSMHTTVLMLITPAAICAPAFCS